MEDALRSINGNLPDVVLTDFQVYGPKSQRGGFPHGNDQWISAAATNWAAMALALSAAPQKE